MKRCILPLMVVGLSLSAQSEQHSRNRTTVHDGLPGTVCMASGVNRCEGEDIHFEYHPVTLYATVHTRQPITLSARELVAIPGVNAATRIKPYSFLVERGEMFNWPEVEASVRKALTPRVREVVRSVITIIPPKVRPVE